MFAIDHVLLTDDVLTEAFVCDLNACKGACCIDGDAGAPLEEDELGIIDDIVDTLKPYLPKKNLAEIEKQGNYLYHQEYGWVTPTIGAGVCVYGFKDKHGVTKCSMEQAYLQGKIDFKKPISCHLFPVTIDKSSDGVTEYVNYEPRADNCKAACALGKKLKVPVYEFLKEPLIRKFGQEFFEAIKATAQFKTEDKSDQ